MVRNREFVSVEAHKGRTIAARLMPGTELLAGIEAVCRAHHLQYGYFASVIGNLRQATYVIPVAEPQAPLGFRYCEPITELGPVEIICGQGLICQSDKGEIMLHLHAHATTGDRRTFAGHFCSEGNPVLTTIELVIVEFDGAKMMRRFDPAVGLVMFSPEL